VNGLRIGHVPEENRVGKNSHGNEFIKNGQDEAFMSEQRIRRNSENANVLQMRDRRTPDMFKNALPNLVRIKVEFNCHQDIGETIKRAINSKLKARGYLLDDYDKPDWILSIIAFRHGELVEMSIIFRRLFRSTTPGTEVELVDSEGHVGLRQGGWLYECLLFHGLFGVPAAELEGFSERLVKDLATEHISRIPPGRVRQEF
jgi:hypothetical protein